MRRIILILGLTVVLMRPAAAQTNQPASPTTATNELPADVLVTKWGATFNQYRVVAKDPAGIIIRYVPEGGGLGMEKIPFDLLSTNWQKRYEYDPKKAIQFDLEQQKAIGFWRDKMISDEQANREKWARLAAEEEAAEQAKRDAEAAAALGTNAVATLTNEVPTMQDTNAPAITVTNQPSSAMPSPSQPSLLPRNP